MTKEMLKLAQEITMRKNPEEALSVVLKSYLERRIEECKREIKKFEKKYGMSFEDYKDKLGEEFPLSYEHEKDYMNWEAAITEYRILNEHFKKIESHGARRVR